MAIQKRQAPGSVTAEQVIAMRTLKASNPEITTIEIKGQLGISICPVAIGKTLRGVIHADIDMCGLEMKAPKHKEAINRRLTHHAERKAAKKAARAEAQAYREWFINHRREVFASKMAEANFEPLFMEESGQPYVQCTDKRELRLVRSVLSKAGFKPVKDYGIASNGKPLVLCYAPPDTETPGEALARQELEQVVATLPKAPASDAVVVAESDSEPTKGTILDPEAVKDFERGLLHVERIFSYEVKKSARGALEFTAAQIAEIKRLASEKVKRSEIAKKFNLSTRSVDRVLAGQFDPK